MIDSYIILNRKTKLIIKIFSFNFFLITSFIIWGINTFYYQTYFKLHSQILYFNSFYYLEVLIPVEEVDQVLKNNKIIINQKTYEFEVHEIEPNITYKNNTNYQKIYLEIKNLEAKYHINGYRINVKIARENKKIIDYLKE